ncbi:hypothetical protein P43SY_008615 [Pythium insidiosum]|uniref:HTH CENPB-type domain-containing protein n=1 Tax=Pythium insidiosum TaxID=114742 RepID=A0AAD5Q6V7_PYTIN|nr:hypothetical protein P43SY_008615 [Pythium insidiosum]
MGAIRKSFRVHEKVEVITWIEEEGGGVPSRAAAFFRSRGWDVDARMCRRWWAQREKLKEVDSFSFRVQGGGRQPILGGLENELLDLLTERRLLKEKVSRHWIAQVAVGLGITDFVASETWVSNFMRRNNLSLRKVTNLTTLSDEELITRAVSFMKFLQAQLSELDLERTVRMDETAVYFEDPRRHTVNQAGARHVVFKSTGFHAHHGNSRGYCRWPEVGPNTDLAGEDLRTLNGCHVAHQPRAWVNQELLIKWLDLAFPRLWVSQKKTIIWDSMRAHIGREVKAHCGKRQIGMCVIPGGLTPYLQAGDIGIYKSFKDKMGPHVDAWKRSDQVEYTRGGNPKPPSISVETDWIRQAWQAVPQSVVDLSIARAGFSTQLDEGHIARHDVYGEQFHTVTVPTPCGVGISIPTPVIG